MSFSCYSLHSYIVVHFLILMKHILRGFLRKDWTVVRFWALVCLKMSCSPHSTLPFGYSIWVLPSVFQALLHCLLASFAPVEVWYLCLWSLFLCGSVRIFSSLDVLKFTSVNKCDFLFIFSFSYPAFSCILRIASWRMMLQSEMKLWPFWPSSFLTKQHLPLLAPWRLRSTLCFSPSRRWGKF